MLLLNIILEMIEKLDSSILGNAQHILSFIAHTLEPNPASMSRPHSHQAASSRGLQLADLKIVDSDDEDEESEKEEIEDNFSSSQDLLFTALNLLLAVLEGTYRHWSVASHKYD